MKPLVANLTNFKIGSTVLREKLAIRKEWLGGICKSVTRNARLWTRSVLILYVLLVTLTIYLAFMNWSSDDPFITYRYSDNIRHGLGFLYNPGERVLSTTTPLFALILALLGYVWQNVPDLAHFLSALSLALGAICLWDLSRSYKTPFVGWASLLLYPTFPLLLNTLGAETTLYLAFCLGSFTFYARQKYYETAIFAALAVLTRPDGILVPIVITVDYLIKNLKIFRGTGTLRWKSFPWSAVIIFFLIAVPWFIFAWVYFGSPIPATLVAKHNQGALTGSQRFGPGLLIIASFYARYWYYWVEVFFAILGGVFMLWRWRRWSLMIVWMIVYFLAYSILGVSRYPWYYAPLVPSMVVLIGVGVEGLFWCLLSKIPIAIVKLQQSLAICLLFVLAFCQIGNLLTLRQNSDIRYPIYRAIGDWLRIHTTPQDQVGALEVGIIGYYARRPMIDFAGLLQPQIAAQLTPETNYETAAIWALEHYHPNYLVLVEGNFTRLEQNYVAQQCQRVERFTGINYNYSGDINIYACR